MSGDLATLTLRNRHLLWLAIAIMLVAGLSSILTIPRLEDPRIVNRGPIVLTTFPGASADRVESLVTDPIETALEEIDEIKTIESTSRSGISVISIELRDDIGEGENTSVFSEIRDELADVERVLPDGAEKPQLDDQRDAIAFTMIAMIRPGDGLTASLGQITRQAEHLADELRQVAGTELVRVYGAGAEEMRVTLDDDARALLGLSAAEIAELIGRADVKGSAGVVRGEESDLLVEVAGELDSVERIAAIPLREGGAGRVLRLGDIASITRTVRTPVDSIAISEGERGVLVAARMNPAVQASAWNLAAKQTLDEFAASRSGIEVDLVFEQARYTTDRLVELGGNLFAGAIVIVLVIWLTLGLREAVIVGLALPLVVSITLTAIQASGNSLHQMSIFGMIIALGLLIDNAIVVTDEVTARRRAGQSAAEAVSRSVRHLAAPLGASTLTTVLAFAPILLLPGSAGDFVGSIGQSVIYAVVASYAVSLLIIAALAGLFAGSTPRRSTSWWRDGVSSQRGGRWIGRLLDAFYRRPVACISLALALPGVGFALVPTLGNQFFPPVDRDMFHVQLWMPSSTALANTAAQAEEAEEIIRSFDGVERVHWLVGGSYPSVWYNLIMDKDSMPSYAHGIVDSTSPEATKQLVDQIQRALDERLPGVQAVVRSFGQGPPVVADIQYRIAGPDTLVLQQIGEAFRARLHDHPDVLHTQMTIERGQPQITMNVNERDARRAGLTLADVADHLRTLHEGATGGTVLEDLEEMPVRVITAEATRGDLSRIASSPIAGPEGEIIPLRAIAAPALTPEGGRITRYQGERTNTIEAYTRPGSLAIDIGAQVLDELRASGPELPVGYTITVGGEAEESGEATGSLATYAPILIVLMVATLVLVFRSVMLAAVLGGVAFGSVGLALLSTWAIDFPVSFNTILGTLGLIGVALNDSIVVIAAIRAHPTASQGDPSGLVEAVMGCLRHVVSTTLTTIGGFLPLLLFTGGDFWPSLAIVMAGGIAGASLLAVLFVPAVIGALARLR